MSRNEVQEEVSTVDEMMSVYEGVETDGGRCEGYIATPGMIEGINEISNRMNNSGTPWAGIGGVYTQVNAADFTGDVLKAADLYKRRTTDDVDIIVVDESDVKSVQRGYNREYSDLPRMDLVDEEVVPGAEELLKSARTVNLYEAGVEDERFDFDTRVLGDAELLYTKTHDPDNMGDGTAFDAKKMMLGNAANIDWDRYKELMQSYSDYSVEDVKRRLEDIDLR